MPVVFFRRICRHLWILALFLYGLPMSLQGHTFEQSGSYVIVAAGPAKYRCPPCGCNYDDSLFDKPGRCPHCNMRLVEANEGFAEMLDEKIAPLLKIGHLGMIFTKIIYPIFVFGIIAAVFFSLKSWRSNKLNIFLTGIILVLSLYGFKNHLFAAAYSPLKTNIGLIFPISFILFLGPLIYFHSKSQLQTDFVWKRKHLLHFVPGIIMFLYYSTLILLPRDLTRSYFGYLYDGPFSHAEQILAVTSAFAYIFFSYSMLKKEGIVLWNNFFKIWLSRFLIGMFVLLLVWSLLIVVNYSLYNFEASTLGYNPLWVLSAIIILWMVLEVMAKPSMFFSIAGEVVPAFSTAEDNGKKYVKSGLSGEKSEEILDMLSDYMKSSKAYLDSTLTLDKVSSDLKTYKHHISQAINNGAGMNFYSFVNEFRIQEVIDKLQAEEHKIKTIEAISFECGFSSKSTFNNLFRKKFGITPSQYIKDSE